MLTPNQEKYLLTIPEDKIIAIKPFDPKVKGVAQNIISKIKEVLPEAKVLFMGASALGIAGQNDIDMTILANREFNRYSNELENLFGKPVKSNPTLIKWEFVKDGFEVELYLNNKTSSALQEQIDTFNLLKNNFELLKEYEQIKLKSDGLPFREYMKRKYEFFNKILNIQKIQIDKYTENWTKLFNEEKKIIQNAIGNNVIIEHIGSTSIAGLGAKPVIDMMVGVEILESVDAFIKPLKKIEYVYIPELELQIPDRKFFQKRIEDVPKYHLSFTEPTSKYWQEHILFRDYLRAHPEAIKEYENLKKELAEKFISDFDAYNAGKTDFINEVVKKAEKGQ